MYYALILLVAASRFLPHPPNVVCIGALGLFAGCYLQGKRAYLVPLAALLLSDLVAQLVGFPGMGFYNPGVMVAVYAGMLASVPIGRWMSNRNSLLKYPAGSLAASTVFFLISNFAVWLAWYGASPAGLIACYTNAIPFYGYSIVGDLIFTTMLFGSWEASRVFASRKNAALATA